MNSNASRPVPPADTGSKLLNWLSDTSMALIHLERRFDPFVRPAFDAVLRDPIARLTTALINSQRTDEGLRLAEERPLPGEEKFVDEIISSFTQQASKGVAPHSLPPAAPISQRAKEIAGDERFDPYSRVVGEAERLLAVAQAAQLSKT